MDNAGRISSLRAEDFRNYSHLAFEPDPRVNLIVGQNAQGKTNLLEAVHLVSTGRLLRPGRDAGAIREGCDSAMVEATISDTGTKIGVELRAGQRKRATLNGASLPRASDLIGRLPSVSFSTTDLGIVTGDPAERRLFMDFELCQLYPSYLRDLTVYKRALEHRNALLRAQSEGTWVDSAQYEPWEQQLAIHGAAIRHARVEWCASLATVAAQAHGGLTVGEALDVAYLSKDEAESESDLAGLLASRRATEAQRGTSSVGPHRDDLTIRVAGRDARAFGSQGQQRSAVISLKLATFRLAEERFTHPPLLLLDDIFSDLDRSRRESLVGAALRAGGQVFLTCTEAEQAGSDLSGVGRLIKVRSGEVESA